MKDSFIDNDQTQDIESELSNYPEFKARPFKKQIFAKVSDLPNVEKREQTTFEEFQLSNPACDLRKRTIKEYQGEIQKMKEARFVARSFDKAKFEQQNNNKRSLSDEKKR